MWASICPTNFASKNISHSKMDSSRLLPQISNGLHVKCPLVFSDFNKTWIFSISQTSLHWERSGSVRTDGQTEGQTDRHLEANSRFRNLRTRLKIKAIFNSVLPHASKSIFFLECSQAVCSQIQTKYKNTRCEKNVTFPNVTTWWNKKLCTSV